MKRRWVLLLAALLALLCGCKQAQTEPDARLGRYDGSEIRVGAGEWQPMDTVYAGQTYLELDAGGAGVFCIDGEAAAITWQADAAGSLTLTLGSAQCFGAIADGTITTGFFDAELELRFCKDGAAQRTPSSADDSPSIADPAEFWGGCWYGWHVVTDASEDLQYLQDTAWDACAEITAEAQRGTIRVWDTENEPGELLCRADVNFAPGTTQSGCMTAEEGSYLGCEITDGWVCDPGRSDVRQFPHMICIEGRAEDENGSWVRYRIYLRPWGMDWEDVRAGDTSGCMYTDMLPPDYDSWYAPYLQSGAPMPVSFGRESG